MLTQAIWAVPHIQAGSLVDVYGRLEFILGRGGGGSFYENIQEWVGSKIVLKEVCAHPITPNKTHIFPRHVDKPQTSRYSPP